MTPILIGHTTAELTALLTEMGLPGYRGKQLARGFYTRFARDFDAFSDLPKALREKLAAETQLAPCSERSVQRLPCTQKCLGGDSGLLRGIGSA